MRAIAPEVGELIEAVVAESPLPGITAGLLEKDVHLTEALRALFGLEHEGLHLVFCGGTSLSKAHGLIERMSEDADIKVVFDAEHLALSAHQRRKRLRQMRLDAEAALKGLGFQEDEEKRRNLNDGHYQCSHWAYDCKYGDATRANLLRPHLQLEFTARVPVLPTEELLLDTLVNRLAGRPGPAFTAPTVSVAETQAEKVLSLLRRFAQHRAGQMIQAWDTALVRHVYDVHCIHGKRPEVLGHSTRAFGKLVAGDVEAFGGQFPAFKENPAGVLSAALAQCESDEHLQREYETQVLPLVYGAERPAFPVAFATFKAVAVSVLPGH